MLHQQLGLLLPVADAAMVSVFRHLFSPEPRKDLRPKEALTRPKLSIFYGNSNPSIVPVEWFSCYNSDPAMVLVEWFSIPIVTST